MYYGYSAEMIMNMPSRLPASLVLALTTALTIDAYKAPSNDVSVLCCAGESAAGCLPGLSELAILVAQGLLRTK